LSQYQFFKSGFLPCAGGLLDQPNKFIEQMQIIEAVLFDERKKR